MDAVQQVVPTLSTISKVTRPAALLRRVLEGPSVSPVLAAPGSPQGISRPLSLGGKLRGPHPCTVPVISLRIHGANKLGAY